MPLIEEDAEICQCCGSSADVCICTPCPTCGVQGNPKCYEDVGGHGLQFSPLQQLGQARLRLANLREQVQEVEQFVQQLEQQYITGGT